MRAKRGRRHREATVARRALGIWTGTTGAGVSLGPIIAGVLLTHLAWGSVFLNVPIASSGC